MSAVDYTRLDDTLDRIEARIERNDELIRRKRILLGLPQKEQRAKSLDEIRAATIAMRAENDQLAAEASGAWRTYD